MSYLIYEAEQHVQENSAVIYFPNDNERVKDNFSYPIQSVKFPLW